jgi:hypothetical protein
MEDPPMAQVYPFRMWDVDNDCFRQSSRYATKERIERMGGEIIGKPVEVDDNVLGQEIEGMTNRNFDPRPPDPHRMR